MWFLIIILLLLIFFLSPIIKVWRAVRKFQNDYNRAMDQAMRNSQAGAQNPTDESNDMKERYRRYRDETGEYVSFEEVKGRPEATSEPSGEQPSSGNNSKYQEEIVSDAEFEEI